MNTKTVLIIAAVSVGGCCLFGTAALILGGLASEAPSAEIAASNTGNSAPASAGAGNDAKLGGYIIFGKSTPVAEGFAESLAGNWMLMDGATVTSIEAIHSDRVEVSTKRSGELWHFSFADDGSYVYRYFISVNYMKVMWVEKGEWSADGTQVTLRPASCSSKSPSETTDCLEPAPRTYALTTLQLEEFTPRDHDQGVIFGGVRFTGPWPSFSPASYRELQRVR